MKIGWTDAFLMSVDITVIGLLYTGLGIFISFIIYYLFEEFEEDWTSKTTTYQIIDIVLELTIVILCAFWISYIIRKFPRLLPIPPEQAFMIDTYAIEVFFLFALFLFLDGMTNKMKYMQEKLFGQHFNAIFPMHGSIVDGTLSYGTKSGVPPLSSCGDSGGKGRRD